MTMFFVKKLLQYKFTILWSVVIFILCAIPSNDIPKSKLFDIPHFDKLVHFAFYLVLMNIWLLENLNITRFSALSWFWFGLFCLSYGSAIEVLQGYVFTSRSLSFFDIVANFTGIIVSYPVFKLVTIRLAKRIR